MKKLLFFNLIFLLFINFSSFAVTTIEIESLRPKPTLNNEYYWEKANNGKYRLKIFGVNNKEYYMTDGIYGVLEINEVGLPTINKYYFDKDGYMYTGFLKVKNNYYYFDETGKMVTGLTSIDGMPLLFDDNGLLVGR